MPDYVVEEIGETPYLYVTGESAMAPEAIRAEMARCFDKVTAFMRTHGIEPAGPPLAVYHDYDPDRLAFRAGVVASSEAMQDLPPGVDFDFLPAGRVLTFVHVGPYATLREHYTDMMDHVVREGLELSAPTWEVYVDDPDTVPEHQLRTKVHVALK